MTTTGQGSRSGQGLGTGLLVGCLVGVLAVCGAGAAALAWLGTKLGLLQGMGRLAALVALLLLVAAGHVAVSVWAWRTRPGRVAVVITQAPHVAGYLAVATWWWSSQWSAWQVLWAVATLAALAWVTVWFLRAPGVTRRAVVYLTTVGVIVAGNSGGVLVLAWQRSNGFGLKGQATPWAAFDALTVTSCLTKYAHYSNGGRVAEADCPTGTDAYSGDYDEAGFTDNLCDPQPTQAFTRWWEWTHQYQLRFTLVWEYGPTQVDGQTVATPYPEEIDGETATLEYVMRLDNVSNVGSGTDYRMNADRVTETWRIHLETVGIGGGWKVCRIDIPDPISATFATS